MPRYVQLVGRWGNAFLVVCFGFITLFMLFDDTRSWALTLFFAVPTAMGAFNIWVIAKAAGLLAEEEWLRGEVRKAELRRRLQDMAAEEARAAAGATPAPMLSLPPHRAGSSPDGTDPD